MASIYVYVPNNGMFRIYSESAASFPPTINQEYTIPSHYKVLYGTQQLSGNLTSGTVKFTKYNQKGLVEGVFSGKDSLNNNVSGSFSVPYESILLRNKLKK